MEGHCQFPFVLVISAALFLSFYQPQLSSTPVHNVSFCLIQSDFCFLVWLLHRQRRMSDHLERCSLEGHCQFPFVLVISAALFLFFYQPELSLSPVYHVSFCFLIQSGFFLFVWFGHLQRRMSDHPERCSLEGHCQFPFVLVISAALFVSSISYSSV